MNIGQMLKQAQLLQQKLSSSQSESEQQEYEAENGGGLVKVKVNGKGRLIDLQIAPELANPNDLATLRELILSASKEAFSKAEANQKNLLTELMAGLNLPLP